MDKTQVLNEIIEYIESHITEDIDFSSLAKIACCSVYDVNRMFLLIADISISEYIRKRRMTLAAFDLKYGGAAVTDTALKYRYDSPVSFTRAFTKFHGVTPSAMKHYNSNPVVFPKLIFQITVKEEVTPMRKDRITVGDKEYEAAYFGEADMSQWSDTFSKREYWRLENAYGDFRDKIHANHVLPYNNYPPVDIKVGQVFAIDYHRKDDRPIERKYYIADGTVWNDLPSTVEVTDPIEPLCTEALTVAGKEYIASYFGEVDISFWSDKYSKREFWRLDDIGNEFDSFKKGNDVLPYNNYPPIEIENGDVFVIRYTEKDGSVSTRYYIADGTVWNGMPSTREVLL